MNGNGRYLLLRRMAQESGKVRFSLSCRRVFFFDRIIWGRMHSSREGAILLLTLWIALILGALVYGILFDTRIEIKLSRNNRDGLKAYGLAKAGVAKGLVDLKNDLVLDHSEKRQVFDAEGDVWAKPEEGKREVEFGDGIFDVEVEDEQGRLNLNTASPALLSNLLMALGYEEEESREVADAIIDWRDWDDRARGESESLEYEYYTLQRQERMKKSTDKVTEVYKTKNDLYTTVDELLMVEGVTDELFYGKQQSRGTRVEKSPGLRDLLTVHGNGRININTAGREVLAAILATGAPWLKDPEDVAEDIIEYRRDGKRKDFDNEKAFRTLGDLNHVKTLGGVVGRIGRYLDVRSSTFRIISTGRVNRARYTIESIVSRSWEQFSRDEKTLVELDDSRERKLREKEPVFFQPAVRVLEWIEE